MGLFERLSPSTSANGAATLAPHDKPLPQRPLPQRPHPSFSPFPSPTPSRPGYAVPRSMPPRSLPQMGGNRKKQEQQHHSQKAVVVTQQETDLIAVFPAPARGVSPAGCAITDGSRNTSGTSSVGDDSVSSSTISPSYALATTVEPLRLRRASPAAEGKPSPAHHRRQQQGHHHYHHHRPRPDSVVLPASSPPLQRPSRLDPRNFAALVRKGDDLQYWLSVDLVLQGIPGRACVPRGHWDRLILLAEAVRVSSTRTRGAADTRGRQEKKASKPEVKSVQLITGWCKVDELMGEAADEPGSA